MYFCSGVPMHFLSGVDSGGNSFYYFIGSYSCSGGKWKGELTTAMA